MTPHGTEHRIYGFLCRFFRPLISRINILSFEFVRPFTQLPHQPTHPICNGQTVQTHHYPRRTDQAQEAGQVLDTLRVPTPNLPLSCPRHPVASLFTNISGIYHRALHTSYSKCPTTTTRIFSCEEESSCSSPPRSPFCPSNADFCSTLSSRSPRQPWGCPSRHCLPTAYRPAPHPSLSPFYARYTPSSQGHEDYRTWASLEHHRRAYYHLLSFCHRLGCLTRIVHQLAQAYQAG